jgi:hypothetical protein
MPRTPVESQQEMIMPNGRFIDAWDFPAPYRSYAPGWNVPVALGE